MNGLHSQGARVNGMYPGLIGDGFEGLDEGVRRAHSGLSPYHAIGDFRITRGQTRLAKSLATLGRLPEASEACAVQLVVSPYNRGEMWLRSFGGVPLVTYQRSRGGDVLSERLGILEFRFRLNIEGGALHYQQIRAGLRLGYLFLPLPAWLAPHVDAIEQGAGTDGTHVRVIVTFPMVGQLIEYEGNTWEEKRC